MAYNFTAIEKKWQQYWLENKTFAAVEPADVGTMPFKVMMQLYEHPLTESGLKKFLADWEKLAAAKG